MMVVVWDLSNVNTEVWNDELSLSFAKEENSKWMNRKIKMCVDIYFKWGFGVYNWKLDDERKGLHEYQSQK